PVATAVGLGAIIGAGIFVLSGTAIALAGSLALLSFALVGVVALIVALETGELGSIMPHLKGAAYSYAYKAFGSELGFITGIVLYFSYATSISAISLGFGSYLASILGMSSAYAVYFAILLIAVLAAVNILGIRKAADADFGLVVVKVSILLIFIGFAIFVAMHNFNATNFALSAKTSTLQGLFASTIVIFFAYSGFQSIATITDRVKGGPKNAARAIVAAVLVSIVLYVLVVLALMLLAPASSYTIAADPLAFALGRSHAPAAILLLVDIGALIATTSATLAMILTSSRTLYQIGKDGLLPRIFRKYNKKSDVAVNGVIISSIIGVVMLFSGNIYVIASIANFGLLFSYLMISLAVLHFRRQRSNPQFKMPGYPYLPIIGIVALIIFFAGMPKEALMIGTMLILALIVIYYTMREIKGKKPVWIRFFR
ncbi:MAG: APC family permease, partial [Candidatus Micrarchaeaceae archaeon]